ncbi:AraC family transcriptional regulator [Arenibacter sp. M-2]|uniref:helix-turn-helix domain-containing protein n=1 Tax=Arenibacter sp. M-2 TaxID=3053612 RepID=UPI002570AB35|nr:AraC family transcriptional regulator [Arenibacter sp. M-2]MDL5511135.1 AraC family transcriptional regulator [Arenibacter sp. M-2]
MIYKKHIPGFPLSQYIEYIIYANGPQSLPYLMELPDGKVNLMIELNDATTNTLFTEKNLQGKHTMKHGWISGSNPEAIVYQCNNDSAIMSIRFALGGFYALTKIPMTGSIYPGLETELLLGSSFNKLYQKLINELDIDLKFKHIEYYFTNYIKDNVFQTSIVKFIDNNLNKPIDWLVSKSGYSQKQLIHLVKTQTGFSPKYLQRLQRFQRVVKCLEHQVDKINWSGIAHEHGYFDQAHFIKEFIHFTGHSPVAYSNINRATELNRVYTTIKLF